MAKKKHLRVLFIGNSHTYYHDLPAWVALMAKEGGLPLWQKKRDTNAM